MKYSVSQGKVDEVVEAFQIFDKDGNGVISIDILLKYGTDFTEKD